MPIQVTCPGCLSRFTVSEKFAGKTGPCPKCKKEIKIPEASEQVVIHAPEDSGPKDAQGRPVLKPLRREELTLSRNAWIGIVSGVVLIFIAAIAIRFTANGQPHPGLLALGSLLIAPPLVVAGYGFLRDSELAGYSGKELLVRGGICSIVFALTWGVYVLLSYYFDNKSVAETPAMQMAILIAIMVAMGTFTSLGALELEFGQAALHYLLYFVVTFVLCMIMGVALGEPLAGPKKGGVPPKVQPGKGNTGGANPSPAVTPAPAPKGTTWRLQRHNVHVG